MIIHTHSHADRFAGVLGVLSEDAAGKVAVIAPKDFVNESKRERACRQRLGAAVYLCTATCSSHPPQVRHNGSGRGAVPSFFVVPGDLVHETGETRLIDGIEFEFQMTMGTERLPNSSSTYPSSALCMSEITSHHLHNVYAPREHKCATPWLGLRNPES